MKLVKTRLRSRLNGCSLARLMQIATEGLKVINVDFNEILYIFKRQNHRIQLMETSGVVLLLFFTLCVIQLIC